MSKLILSIFDNKEVVLSLAKGVGKLESKGDAKFNIPKLEC